MCEHGKALGCCEKCNNANYKWGTPTYIKEQENVMLTTKDDKYLKGAEGAREKVDRGIIA